MVICKLFDKKTNTVKNISIYVDKIEVECYNLRRFLKNIH